MIISEKQVFEPSSNTNHITAWHQIIQNILSRRLFPSNLVVADYQAYNYYWVKQVQNM